jgi:hypothetical protein
MVQKLWHKPPDAPILAVINGKIMVVGLVPWGAASVLREDLCVPRCSSETHSKATIQVSRRCSIWFLIDGDAQASPKGELVSSPCTHCQRCDECVDS